MGALLASEFYDIVDEDDGYSLLRIPPFFAPVLNLDADVDLSLSTDALDTDVYTDQHSHGKITVMSIFRKDLFISITLPVCVVVCGAYAFTWASFTRVDDANRAVLQAVAEQSKAQAVSTEQVSTLAKLQQESNVKLEKIGDQLGALNTSLEVLKAGQKQSPDS